MSSIAFLVDYNILIVKVLIAFYSQISVL